MNYYPFHIGDYSSHTKHLTLMGDLAYRRLLDMYYMTERPLPLDPAECARLIGMRDHICDVSEVLSDFFLKSDAGWVNLRADSEISTYRQKADRAKAANSKRWNAAKNLKSDVKSDAVLIPTKNQEPRTKNTPISPQAVNRRKASDSFNAVAYLVGHGVDEGAAREYLMIRKTKGKVNTERAIRPTIEAARSAGKSVREVIDICCSNSWAQWSGEWLSAKPNGSVTSISAFAGAR